ncbi:MAG: GNAT family N-acetyltransferase, partial [Actinomycetota bacterium]|nr:GNAT family N-acetyltransferase [Actinomycetota bacterium]
AAYCALKEAMIAEVPLGDLQFEPECWDEQRLREAEAELIAMGRTRLVVAAATGAGSIVAHNEVLHAAHDPGRLYNWDTLVLPGHRGHRLGLSMKVANLRRVQRLHPHGRVHTDNAAQNATDSGSE